MGLKHQKRPMRDKHKDAGVGRFLIQHVRRLVVGDDVILDTLIPYDSFV